MHESLDRVKINKVLGKIKQQQQLRASIDLA